MYYRSAEKKEDVMKKTGRTREWRQREWASTFMSWWGCHVSLARPSFLSILP